MRRIKMKKSDPKSSNGKFVAQVTKVYIDDMDVSKLPGGTWGSRGRQEAVSNNGNSREVVKKQKSAGPKNPGATMKAIKGTTSGKVKSGISTRYKSTGSKEGKATPSKKRKRGA